MYLMYVDECGDKGMSHDSSRYFILSGMVVHESNWLEFGKAMSRAKHKAYNDYGLDTRLELHAKSMLESCFSLLSSRTCLSTHPSCCEYVESIALVLFVDNDVDDPDEVGACRLGTQDVSQQEDSCMF